ncbi:LysE family translocator [Pseudoroseicyclus sp. CXY001]|uniref:LysE family translocator n=1 Tax=Pseudoroseicyclus sp. CXY001 TaxID=3242492 RepID=UPI0035715232
MELAQLAAFAAAYFAIIVLPGPAVTALVARVLARGGQGAPALIAGCVLGSLTWLMVAATGLALIAASFQPLFVAIRYAGAAYLLYLAWKFWRAEPRMLAAGEAPAEGAGRLFLTGLAINLGNPKAVAFYLAVLPSVVDLGGLTGAGLAELAVTTALVASSVLSGYAILAARARARLATPERLKLLSKLSSLVMAATAIRIVTR